MVAARTGERAVPALFSRSLHERDRGARNGTLVRDRACPLFAVAGQPPEARGICGAPVGSRPPRAAVAGSPFVESGVADQGEHRLEWACHFCDSWHPVARYCPGRPNARPAEPGPAADDSGWWIIAAHVALELVFWLACLVP